MPSIPWTELRKALTDFRRTWPQLLLTDLLARTLAAVLIAPVVGLLLKLFLMTTPDGVLADAEIAAFALSPLGLTAIVVVGAVSLGIWFAEQGMLLVIGLGAVEDRRVTWLDALSHVVRCIVPLVRLGGLLIVRLLLIVAPFLAAAGGVYLLFLGRYDINFYLADRPPAFWGAVFLTGLLLLGLAVILLRKVSDWILTVPLVLFEATGARRALDQSRRATAPYGWRIACSLAAWFATLGLLSWLLAFFIGRVGGLLVPDAGGSLVLMAAGLVAALLLSFVINLTFNIAATSLLPLFVVRLYGSLAGPVRLSPSISDRGVLGSRAELTLPGKRYLATGVAALAVVVVGVYIGGRSISQPDEVIVIAHRGASGEAPENTMAAFEGAMVQRADWIELDVQENADGEVIVQHDSDFKRVGRADLKVWNATNAELHDLDVGSWFGPEFSDQRVPRLRQVLERAKGQLGVVIELKYYGHDRQLESKVVEIVEATEMEGQIMIMSLKTDGLRKIAALRPSWTRGLLNTVSVGDLTRRDLNFLALNAAAASRSQIRRAHRRGMKVYAWTIDEPVQLSVMMSRGVDGVITDRPAVARQVLEFREELSPIGRFIIWVAGETGFLRGAEEASPVEDA
ncbi:MAG: glycerophosphoryl diester phosphodiesterase membrane domain-containing protein [Gemmatimonadota bacterium]|nr:MAG: glycerophosphoryl diester phosphodiesterase membrane domain-containing protein [Gemmatimonadota bacterium]